MAQGLQGVESPDRPGLFPTPKLSIRRIPKDTSMEELRQWLLTLGVRPDSLHPAKETAKHRDSRRYVATPFAIPLCSFSGFLSFESLYSFPSSFCILFHTHRLVTMSAHHPLVILNLHVMDVLRNIRQHRRGHEREECS